MAIHTHAGIAGVDSGFGVTQSPVDLMAPNDLQVFLFNLESWPDRNNKQQSNRLGTTVERVRTKQILARRSGKGFYTVSTVVCLRACGSKQTPMVGSSDDATTMARPPKGYSDTGSCPWLIVGRRSASVLCRYSPADRVFAQNSLTPGRGSFSCCRLLYSFPTLLRRGT